MKCGHLMRATEFFRSKSSTNDCRIFFLPLIVMADQNRFESRIDKTLSLSGWIVFPFEIIIKTDLPVVENFPICSVTCNLNDYLTVIRLKLLRQSVRVYIFPGEGAVHVFAEFPKLFKSLLFLYQVI